MPLDTSLPLQGYQPESMLARQAKQAQLDTLDLTQKAAAFDLQGKQDDRARLNRLTLLASQTDPTQLGDALSRGGFLKEAADYRKNQADAGKAAADTQKAQLEAATKRIDLVGQTFNTVRQAPTLENAHAAVDYLAQNGVYTPEQAMQMKQKIAADPSKIGQMAEMAFRSALSAKDQLASNTSRNTGGSTDTISVDPVTQRATVINSVRNTQSPDSVASTGLGYAKLGEERRHNGVSEGASNGAVTYQTDANGQLVALPTKLAGPGVPVARVVMGADGQPLNKTAPGGKMTEDQGKATGWLIQAENAFKNMKSSGFDASGNPKSAAYPGVNDALDAVPLLSGAANSMRGSDRQKFIQSSSSLSEALLRAATGAGVNESEAKQKIQELTPRFGESASTTKQKMDAIPLYIESLKVRAGPGSAKAASVLGGSNLPTGWTVKAQ